MDMSGFFCDWPTSAGKTCDLPLCEAHAVQIGPNKHHCPAHALEALQSGAQSFYIIGFIMSKLARDHRNSDMVKIHIAKKQLGLADEDYRAILLTQGGADSSKGLDHSGRQRVLTYFKFLGFKPVAAIKSKRPARPTPSADALPLVRRIRAQLISLDRLPDDYADGIAKQMLQDAAPQFFEWCHVRDLEKISQALTYQQRRTGAPTK